MPANLAASLNTMLQREIADSQMRNEEARERIKVSLNPESIRIFEKSIAYREKRLVLLAELVEARKAKDDGEVEKKMQEMKTLYFTTFPA
jgi:hypothetical protein|uniref:Uncharacterized protein n=1 Tax=viral metagenome TaxID=1070528 RepID=A0A6C0CS96_9ZZZZ